MIDRPDKTVAFLDLLGFSEGINTDMDGAIRLLQDHAGALAEAVKDAVADSSPETSAADPAVSRLTKITAVTSFEALQATSDSILIVSANPSLFVLQLSQFLLSCFRFRSHAFLNPEFPDDPRRVTIATAIGAGDQSRIVMRSETWWPVLFRGGVAYGECSPVKLPAITSGSLNERQSFVGRGVVEAVGLEKLTKGPRILCTESLQAQVQGDAAEYIAPAFDDRDRREIYWPMAMFEDKSNLDDAINNGFRQWLCAVANLYQHFRGDDHVRAHYESYLRLLVASALRKYPTAQSALRSLLHNLDPDVLKIAFFPPSSVSSGESPNS